MDLAACSFDPLALDTLTLAEKGMPFTPRNPKTLKPVTDADGNPLVIMLLGRRSSVAQTALAVIQARIEARPLNAPPLTPEEHRANNAEFMAALTLGWNFTHFGKEPFPFTPANARRLWSEPRLPTLLGEALEFVKDDGNFLGDAATATSTGPSDASAFSPLSQAVAPTATT